MLFYIMYYIIALQVAVAQDGDAANYSALLLLFVLLLLLYYKL